MKKILSLLLCFCIVFSSASTVSALDINIQLPKSLDSFTEDVSALISEYEEISSYDDAVFFTASDDEGENIEGTNRLIVKSSKSIDTLNAINSVSGYNDLHILQFENAEDCQTALEYYSSLSYVEYAQEDGILKETAIEEAEGTFSEASIGMSTQYQSDIFGYTNAKANMGSAPVTIAVVDTGVQNDHEYLAGRVEPTGFDSVYNESCYDKRGHGTHVAGIIVSNTKSNVKIKPYKVIGDDGTGTDTQLYLGIQAAIEDGVDIINLSLTRKGESEIVHEAVINAYNAGITVVAAAGNDNANLAETFYTPACFDEVICVVNIDVNKKRSSTSNWRFNDTLSAPGVDILSSYVGNTYKVMSGTSMAAPFISSCVAYLFAMGDYYTPDEAYDILYANTLVGATASIHYVVPGEVINSTSTCATPVFMYDTGTFSGYLNVKITCATPGATIMYHTNSMNSDTYYEYTGPIYIEKNTSFTAYAFAPDYKTSATASESYTKSNQDTSMFIIDENDVLIGYTGTETEVTVPGYFDGGAVLKVGASAFSGNTSIKKITLNSVTTTIGEGAFEGCTSLTSVTGTGVTTIEAEAFKDCTSLTTLSMSSLLTIGERAFSGCTALTSFRFTKLNTLGDYAFENSSINTLTATRLTTIGKGAFSGSAVKSVSLTSVTTIEDNAFENCDYLTELTLTSRITALGDNVYKGCKNLATVTLEGITTLGNGTFRDCTALTTVTANNLTKIGDYTFSGCSSLGTFTLTALTSIGNYAFYGCKAIKEMKTTDFPELTTVGDYAFAESGLETFKLSLAINIGYKAFGDCEELKGVSLPCITEFDAGILEGSKNIERLTFQNAKTFDFSNGTLADLFPNLISFTATISEIPDHFFEGCSKLSEVDIASDATIGSYAFKGTAVKIICFGSASIFDAYAFAYMPALEEVTLQTDTVDFSIFEGSTNVKKFTMRNLAEFPEGFRCYDVFPNIETLQLDLIRDVPDYTFKGCSKLTDFDFFDIDTVGYEAFCGTAVKDPYFSDAVSIGERAFADCTNLGDFSAAGLADINMNIFENSEHTVTELNLNYITFEESPNYGNLDFQKFVNLESIGINKLKDIPAYAFRNLSKLNQIYMGECETIGAHAFENCVSLQSFEFSNIKKIDSKAFAGCTGLQSFKANKLTSFSADAFSGCTNLKTMDLGNISKLPVDSNGRFQLAGVDNLESLTANSIETIPANFLKGYHKLKTVSFKSADNIGDYAFYDTALSSYTIPNAQTVGEYAFYGTNIETVDFTEITSIGSYAFADCDNIEEINISYQITVGDGAFANCDLLSAITLSDVKNIPANVIEGCPDIVVIEFNQITELPVDEDGTTYVSDKPLLEEFLADYVTSVPDDYFSNNPALFNVYMPSLEYVGDRAFMNTSIVEYPSDYIVHIGDYAFSGTGLKKAYNNCVEEVGDYAFKDCKALTKAKINNENGDFTLGVGVFENCTSLTGVALYKDEVELPAYTFKNCVKLKEVHNKATFGGNVIDPELLLNFKSIGEEAFYGCESMGYNTIILDNVEYLGDNALVGVQKELIDNELVLPKLKYLGEGVFGETYMFSLTLENVEVVKGLPDCGYAVIGSDIKEFSCNRTEPIICAYEDSVVAEFCRENGMDNFRAYNSTDAVYYDVDSAITNYDQILMFYPMGFDLTYEWYACNRADRSDSVLIKTTYELPNAIEPLSQFAQNNLENKYKYFYCVATSTENGNVLRIQSSLCRNIYATIKGTEDTTIDFDKGLIYTHSLNNINTLKNIFTVNGDVRVTPSHKTEADNYYGTGTVVELLEGNNVAFTQTIVVFGDVNGDGVIDVLDASEIEKASNDNLALEGHYEAAADINSSGKIDVLDYQASINKALAS